MYVPGMALSGYLFNGADVDTVAVFNDLILWCNIAVTCIFIFFLFAFKEKPNHPPTKVAL